MTLRLKGYKTNGCGDDDVVDDDDDSNIIKINENKTVKKCPKELERLLVKKANTLQGGGLTTEKRSLYM